VEYGQLLEGARYELMHSGVKKPFSQRVLQAVLNTVWNRPFLLWLSFNLTKAFRASGLPRLLVSFKLAKALSPRLEFALALLDVSRAAKFEKTSNNIQPNTKSAADQRGNSVEHVSIFTGCVMEGLFTRVNRATARVLEVNGCRVQTPEGQGCCGALHAHAGDLDGARILAKRNIEAFENAGGEPIVTNAGGCGAMLISYEHLLEHDAKYAERARHFSARVRDISQQMAVTGVKQGAKLTDATVTYDASCHLIYGQHAGTAPLKMLAAIPGLKLVPLEGCEMCCGGAGVYNLIEREMSEGILETKLENIKQTGATVLATGNPGCHMQIGAGARLAGMDLNVCHPVELLDESYRRAGLSKADQN
jgi:glycolate oxidase iron-sulfur subunit